MKDRVKLILAAIALFICLALIVAIVRYQISSYVESGDLKKDLVNAGKGIKEVVREVQED